MSAGGGVFSFSVQADINNAAQALAQLEARINAVGAAAVKNLSIRFDVINKQTAARDIQETERLYNAMQARLQAKGIDVPIKVNIREAEKDILNFKNIAEGALRGLFRGSGMGGGVPVGLGFGIGAAGIVAAGQATETMTRAVVQGVQAGIEYNSMLEQATRQFVRYTGSVEGANKVISALTDYADRTPFGTEETIKTGQDLIRVTDGNVEKMQELLKLSGALAVTNPYQGLEGASYAIRELISGDTQSFADRFNTSRALLQQLRREATSTDEYVKLAVAAAGGSTAQIEGLSQTFQGRLSTIQSFIAQLGQRLTAGFFSQLSAAAGEATSGITAHGDAWRDTAEGIGVAAAGIVGSIAIVLKAITNLGPGSNSSLENLRRLGEQQKKQREEEDVTSLPVQQRPEYKANLKNIEDSVEAQKKNKVAIDEVDLALKNNAVELQHVNNAAQALKVSYEQQLRPLERQLELLGRPEWDRARRVAALDIGIAGANAAGARAAAPADVQGQVAQRKVEIEVATKLVEIENRRAEIAQQFVDAANRGKTALEQQSEAQSKFVHELQEEHQQVQDTRARRLEGLREEIETIQTARRERLDGLREEQRAVQENRREIIDALREQHRVAQDARRDDLDALKESHRVELENIQDAERAFESAHKDRVSAYQVQIDKLRQRLDAEKQTGPTAAEQQLSGLDKKEREYDRGKSLADAVRAVREADTIKERLDAKRRLQEVQHEQEVAKKREALQEQIEKEKEAREARRAAIQEQINNLERAAREEDRVYQQQKDVREEQAEATRRTNAETERQAEIAAKQTERAETAAIREAEKVAKEKDLTDARTFREEERAAKAQDKIDAATIRAEEVAAREADRIEQGLIRAEQKRERELSDAATKQREEQSDAKQKAADERAAKLAPLELARLANEERLLTAQDTAGKARAEGEKVRLEAIKGIEIAEGNIYKANQDYKSLGIQEEIVRIKDAEYLRVDALTQQKEQIELARGGLQEQKLILEAQNIALDLQIGQLRVRNLLMLAEAADNPKNKLTEVRVPTSLGNPVANIIAEGLNTSKEFRVGLGIAQNASNEFFAGLSKTWRNLSINFSKILPDEMVAGFVTWIAGDKNAETESLNWAQRIFRTILGFFGIESPSTLMQNVFAKGLIDGAVLGIKDGQQSVIDAFIAVFGGIGDIAAAAIVGENGIVALLRRGLNLMNVDLTTLGPQITENLIRPFVTADIGGKAIELKNKATDAWNGLSTDLMAKSDGIFTALKNPFESLLNTFFPGFLDSLKTTGTNGSNSWITGWNVGNIGQAISTTFNNLFTGFFDMLNTSFKNSGLNAAISWINGYVQQFNNWVAQGGQKILNAVGLGGGGQQPQQQAAPQAPQQQQASPQQQYQNNYGNRSDPLPNLFGGNKDAGGSVFPGQWYKVQADEGFATFSQPGSVLSRGSMSRLGDAGGGGGQKAQVTVNINPGAVQVQTTGVDERQLGQRLGKQIVAAVVTVLDEAERFSSTPVDRTLGGAD